jgi:hypothetical protein
MKNLRYALLLIVGAGLVATLATMGLATRSASGGGSPNGPPVLPEVRQMLHDVSADRIQQTIEKLVSFGTRHTLSTQTDPNRGIGAATN